MPCFIASNIHFISAKDQLSSTNISNNRTRRCSKNTSNHEIQKAASTTTTAKNNTTTTSVKGVKVSNSNRPTAMQGQLGTTQQQSKQRKNLRYNELDSKELERLHNEANYLSAEKRIAALAKEVQLKKENEVLTNHLREHYKKIDNDRLAAINMNQVYNPDEIETEKQKILERAFINRQEQEQEVKEMNRILFDARCRAVLDAQLQERREIKKAETPKPTPQCILIEEDCSVEEKNRKLKFAEEFRKHMANCEQLRRLEEEQAKMEVLQQRAIAAVYKREDELDIQRARDRRKHLNNEIKCNLEISNKFKKMMYEQEREDEARAAAYLQEKTEREKDMRQDLQMNKDSLKTRQLLAFDVTAKAQEHDRLRRLLSEELNYIRGQEDFERNFRESEKKSILYKQRYAREVKEVQENRIKERILKGALQLTIEEQEYKQHIEFLNKDTVREEEELKKKRQCFYRDITKQMRENIEKRRRLAEKEKEEEQFRAEAERERIENIRLLISGKMAALEDTCLPKYYVKLAEKKFNQVLKANQ